MTANCDVLVLGGGPAGLATAMRLARRGWSVVVLEASAYQTPRAGETLGGELRPLLQDLGVWDAFCALEHRPFRGVRSAWGTSEPAERASILHPYGDGWHVDRRQVDAMLATCAAEAGVDVRRAATARGLHADSEGWVATLADGTACRARFVVEASGRGAPATATAIAERRWIRLDRQVALVARTTAPTVPVEPELLLETVENGWWYSVPQPDGALLLALATDADLLPARGGAALADFVRATLPAAPLTHRRCAGTSLAGAVFIVRSETGVLVPDRGLRWRAVGDAALGLDFLAGDGVVRALRAAARAAHDIDRQLAGAASQDSTPPTALLADSLQLRQRYYHVERRWPTAPFWARRQPPNWQDAPLVLAPTQLVQRSGSAKASAAQWAPVEALVPPSALREVMDLLSVAQPAHVALAVLARAVPLPPRQLLAGLQLLLRDGWLTVVDPAAPTDGLGS